MFIWQSQFDINSYHHLNFIWNINHDNNEYENHLWYVCSAAQRILKRAQCLADLANNEGLTALHLAAKEGFFEMADCLITVVSFFFWTTGGVTHENFVLLINSSQQVCWHWNRLEIYLKITCWKFSLALKSLSRYSIKRFHVRTY